MANKLKPIAWVLLLVAAFLAGGWFFRQLPNLNAPKGEVEELYQADGEAFGIFDNIPAEDMAAAEAVAAEALGMDVPPLEEVEEETQPQESASQVATVDFSEIAEILPKDPQKATYAAEDYVGKNNTVRSAQKEEPLALNLTGEEVVSIGPQQNVEAKEDEESKISLIAAPVKTFLIKNTDEYKLFKTRARGGYPEVDFGKKMLVVLESDSNLPDNIFEIVSAEIKDGQLVVAYRVNVFGLDKKTNTHTVWAVQKTELPIELKQVL